MDMNQRFEIGDIVDVNLPLGHKWLNGLPNKGRRVVNVLRDYDKGFTYVLEGDPEDFGGYVLNWSKLSDVQRGDVVTFTGKDDPMVVKEAVPGDCVCIYPNGAKAMAYLDELQLIPNRRDDGLAFLVLNERRQILVDVMVEAEAALNDAKRLIREAQDRHEKALEANKMLSNIIDEMFKTS